MNKIQSIFDKYNDKTFKYTAEPATGEQLNSFLGNCKPRGIPAVIVNELMEYYKQNNNFFNYFTCDDITIFEWYDNGDNCLWLGQRDLWTFRCLIE